MARQQDDQRWEKVLRALGIAVKEIERHTYDGAAEGPTIHDIRIKLEADNKTSTLMIVKAHGANGEIIAFIGGLHLEETLLSLAKRLKGGSVRWREDRPWNPGGTL